MESKCNIQPMDNLKDDSGRTVILDDNSDSIEELSEYLDALSNSTRLKILKIIAKTPKDIRQISSEIGTSYENTKKHLDKLLGIGVVRKDAGLGRPTSKGIHPVWKYSLVPGGMEAIVRNLGLFTNIRLTLTDSDLHARLDAVKDSIFREFPQSLPVLIVLGGADDGRVFPLQAGEIAIGRSDADPKSNTALLLPGSYAAVTRISRPHARLVSRDGNWVLMDCGSTGGTYVNGVLLLPHQEAELADGDLIDLAKGVAGVSLIYIRQKAGPGGGTP
jgi:DNA-binding transcriptional ArsR family regulator